MIDNQMRTQVRCSLLTLCSIWFFSAFIPHPLAGDDTRSSDWDRDALVALENEWLENEHSAAALERILASDFLHPVLTGDLLTKAQHIEFSSKHVPPLDRTKHFEGLKVRIYGEVGIVNGVVVATDKDRNTVDKTVFTDVFVYRDGRWQAVNAQENAVIKADKSR